MKFVVLRQRRAAPREPVERRGEPPAERALVFDFGGKVRQSAHWLHSLFELNSSQLGHRGTGDVGSGAGGTHVGSGGSTTPPSVVR